MYACAKIKTPPTIRIIKIIGRIYFFDGDLNLATLHVTNTIKKMEIAKIHAHFETLKLDIKLK